MSAERGEAAGALVAPISIYAADRAALARAVGVLDGGSGLLVRMADRMGGAMSRTLRGGARRLGVAVGVEDRVRAVAAWALRQAFDVAVLGLADGGAAPRGLRGRMPRAAVTISGAFGGFLGLGGFAPDAAVTTLVIMREIARTAQESGESLSDEDTRRACLEVFALTPGNASEGRPELGYLSARLLMRGRPLMVLMGEVAGRYGLSLSQKFVLQATPVAGALSGAALNGAFLSRYRKAARAHFTVRALERRYGAAVIEREIEEMRGAQGRH